MKMPATFEARRTVRKLWWYELNGEPAGPVDEDDLLNRHNEGAVTRQSLVWSEGMADWLPIELVLNLPTLPPPIPADLLTPSAGTAPFEAPEDLAVTPTRPPAWGPAASGVRRLIARLIDGVTLSGFGFALAFVVGTSLGLVRIDGNAVTGDYQDLIHTLFLLVLFPFMLAVSEALFWLVFKTTPGKALLGVRVQDPAGVKVSRLGYGSRLARLYLKGLWLNAPLLNFVAVGLQQLRLRKRASTSYDERRYLVTYRRQQRIFIALLSTALVVVASVLALGLTVKVLQELEPDYTETWSNPLTNRMAQVSTHWASSSKEDGEGTWTTEFKLSPDTCSLTLVQWRRTAARYSNAEIVTRVAQLMQGYSDVVDRNLLTTDPDAVTSNGVTTSRMWGSLPKHEGFVELDVFYRESDQAMWAILTRDTKESLESRRRLTALRGALTESF